VNKTLIYIDKQWMYQQKKDEWCVTRDTMRDKFDGVVLRLSLFSTAFRSALNTSFISACAAKSTYGVEIGYSLIGNFFFLGQY